MPIGDDMPPPEEQFSHPLPPSPLHWMGMNPGPLAVALGVASPLHRSSGSRGSNVIRQLSRIAQVQQDDARTAPGARIEIGRVSPMLPVTRCVSPARADFTEEDAFIGPMPTVDPVSESSFEDEVVLNNDSVGSVANLVGFDMELGYESELAVP